jgi:type II restriction enzyme
LDEGGDLFVKKLSKKVRAIAEMDTDGTFVITTREVEESEKIKKLIDFQKFFAIYFTRSNQFYFLNLLKYYEKITSRLV